MRFKNSFEEHVFSALNALPGVRPSITHNQTIVIERADAREVATFSGPPKKEIDVLQAEFEARPNLKVLISCKDYGTKADPADVQEWVAVIAGMNRYAVESQYLGLVVCTSGFTPGCEGWATMENVGLLPSVDAGIKFSGGSLLRMVQRVLGALNKRLRFSAESLMQAPKFHEFCYELVTGFEPREQYISERYTNRYVLTTLGLQCSFEEFADSIRGQKITAVQTRGGIGFTTSENWTVQVVGDQVMFGPASNALQGDAASYSCSRHMQEEKCDINLIRGLVQGHRILELGDWGKMLLFGLSNGVMLSITKENFDVDYDRITFGWGTPFG